MHYILYTTYIYVYTLLLILINMENTGYYGNKFFLSVPKKQAKSYEIDLGQNEGAYKEELLIRYGDNTVNQLMSKQQRGNNMNMEDIMRMNEQLRPFQERQRMEGVVSYTEMCEQIEKQIGRMDDNDALLNEFESNLGKAIDAMTSDIFKFFDDTYNEFNPKLLEKYKYLKSRIKEQKDENANLLKQIDLLLQENTQIMDMVYKVGARLETLEKKVGVEKDDDVEEEEKESGSDMESRDNDSEELLSNVQSSQEREQEEGEEGEEEGGEGEEGGDGDEEGEKEQERSAMDEEGDEEASPA